MMTKEPKPCQKYRRVNAAVFVRHVKEDKYPRCLTVVRYLQGEY
jgi:hypothetical protein